MALCSRCKKREAPPNLRLCLDCARYMQAAREKHRGKEKPPGSCSRTDCSNPATPGRASCDSCRARELSYESRNREKYRAKSKELRRQQRLRVFERYGGASCACCGEGHYEFLTIDHIKGDGAAHRRETNNEDIYRWLERNDYPPGFRVLCMNCNFALGYHGYCPHHGWTQEVNRRRYGKK